MSQFSFLERKLDFLRDFYSKTTAPFLEIMRKIEEGEEPYTPVCHEDDVEPPFLLEWSEANEALRLQQQVCLILLQRSLREFLDAVVRRHPRSRPKRGGNWFQNYKGWFFDELNIDWAAAPADLNRIEELSEARNAIGHGGEKDYGPGKYVPKKVFDSNALLKLQNADYQQKFPDAFYANEIDKKMNRGLNGMHPVKIELTPEKLDVAIADILKFCGYINTRLPGGLR